jgi:hypothetical protein
VVGGIRGCGGSILTCVWTSAIPEPACSQEHMREVQRCVTPRANLLYMSQAMSVVLSALELGQEPTGTRRVVQDGSDGRSMAPMAAAVISGIPLAEDTQGGAQGLASASAEMATSMVRGLLCYHRRP